MTLITRRRIFRFWTMGCISTHGVSVRIYSRRTKVLAPCVHAAPCKEGPKPTMMNAKLLELGCANAEGNDLDNEYAKRG
jgi:hypothetical protein